MKETERRKKDGKKDPYVNFDIFRTKDGVHIGLRLAIAYRIIDEEAEKLIKYFGNL